MSHRYFDQLSFRLFDVNFQRISFPKETTELSYCNNEGEGTYHKITTDIDLTDNVKMLDAANMLKLQGLCVRFKRWALVTLVKARFCPQKIHRWANQRLIAFARLQVEGLFAPGKSASFAFRTVTNDKGRKREVLCKVFMRIAYINNDFEGPETSIWQKVYVQDMTNQVVGIEYHALTAHTFYRTAIG